MEEVKETNGTVGANVTQTERRSL